MPSHPDDQKFPSFDLQFQATNDWLVPRGWKAGFPNFHSADHGGGPVHGTYLMYANVADWLDVPKTDLENVASDDYRRRLTTAYDFANSRGYVHGFPNFHQAVYGQGVVYGTFLIKQGFAQWRDVPATDLGMSGRPTNYALKTWFRRVSDYAFNNGFPAGMPNGHYANHGGAWFIGCILFNPGSIEWQDVPGAELGYGTPVTPVERGVERIGFNWNPKSPSKRTANLLGISRLEGARIVTVQNVSTTKPDPVTNKFQGIKVFRVWHEDVNQSVVGKIARIRARYCGF